MSSARRNAAIKAQNASIKAHNARTRAYAQYRETVTNAVNANMRNQAIAAAAQQQASAVVQTRVEGLDAIYEAALNHARRMIYTGMEQAIRGGIAYGLRNFKPWPAINTRDTPKPAPPHFGERSAGAPKINFHRAPEV